VTVTAFFENVPMNDSIYQPQALEKLTSPERLDQLMPITQPRAWIALLGIGLLLSAAVLWSLLGSVKTTVSAYGSIERIDAVLPVRAPVAGTVAGLVVAVDQVVQAGQTLAYVVPAGAADADVNADASAATTGKPVPLVSPAEGRVLDIRVQVEQPVAAAEMVLNVERAEQPLSAVLYVATPEAYQVQVGMEAKVLPATASQHEGAYLLGRVVYAGRYPDATEQQSAWYNPSTAGNPTLKVIVELDAKHARPDLYSGTPCQGVITLQERRPVQMIFSALVR
jgi:hypothetical protein